MKYIALLMMAALAVVTLIGLAEAAQWTCYTNSYGQKVCGPVSGSLRCAPDRYGKMLCQ